MAVSARGNYATGINLDAERFAELDNPGDVVVRISASVSCGNSIHFHIKHSIDQFSIQRNLRKALG